MNTFRTSFPQPIRVLLVALLALSFAACGAENPSSPSAASTGVVLNGSIMGGGSSSSAFGVSAHATPTSAITGTVTVTLQGSSQISTTVSADGSFTLRGLPAGSFTLLFTRDGSPLGTLTFNSVMPNQEVTITISVNAGSVVLVQEKRDGIGHGDVEIEGRVEQVLGATATLDHRFIIDRRTVVVRPGQTSIRQGSMQHSVADLTVGARVHVKGAWLPPEGAVQSVLAHEIKLRDDDDEDDDDNPPATPTPTPRADCVIQGGTAGRDIELQGTILSGTATAFRLNLEGGRASGPVDVLAGSATLECTPKSGPNAPTPAQCAASVSAGARVHVSGKLDSCTASRALVSARKVQVQK